MSALLALAAAASLAPGAATIQPAAPPAAASAQKPRLVFVGLSPVRARGVHFRPRERVRVVLIATTRAVRIVHATADGSFTVAFRGVPADLCSLRMLYAVDSRGTTTESKLPLPVCAPD
jgi:hypothetical protein